MDLQKGDIIKLDNKISDESVVKLELRLYSSEPGVVNKKKAIKISRKKLNLEQEIR
jgi:flagellar motor switch protein FliM